jgi:spore coat protein CotH
MIANKKIERWIIGIVIASIILTGVLLYLSKHMASSVTASDTTTLAYATEVFNSQEIMSVDIQMSETAWQELLDNATDEEYVSADVVVNGKTYKNVGIRCKGNTSLSQVASDDTTDRYSFKIKFDEYVDGQTCEGLDKMALNNIIQDATYMKEYLSYDLMSYIGVAAPLYSFSNISVNGEAWGLYLAVECLNESFAQRNYGEDYGALYKVESMSMGQGGKNQEGGMQAPPDMSQGDMAGQAPPGMNNDGTSNEMKPNVNQDGITDQKASDAGQDGTTNQKASDANQDGTTNQTQPNINQDKREGQILPDVNQSEEENTTPAFGNGGPNMGMDGSSGGTDLVYTDDEIESYSGVLGNPSYDVTKEEQEAFIEALKNLGEGNQIEKYVDVEQTLRYFAANTVLVNLDSYVSNMQHNIYIYEQAGQLTPIPWDYNLAFAGFQSGDSTSAINFPIDTPVSGVELSERPLLGKLLENEEYLELYHEYLQEIVSGYFDSGTFSNTIDFLNQLIGEEVKNDPSAFYTNDEYQQAIVELKEFGKLRALSIQGQLNGTIPSTTAAQEEDSSALIDGSSVDISAMGNQGGGSMGGGRTMQTFNQETGTEEQMAAEQGEAANEDGTVQADQMEFMRGQEEENTREQGMKRGFGQEAQTSNTISLQNILITGGLVVILLAAIIVTKLWKRRKS